MLKRSSVLIIFTVIVLVACNRFSICEEDNKEVGLDPDISFENPEHDFGDIFSGEKVGHIYKFKNKSKGELKINEVKTSCGCTAVIISSKNIPYNGDGEIKVAFNTKSDVGKVSKNITVYSNDPDTPEYKLTISGIVIEEVVVTPAKLDFAEFLYGTVTTKNILIKSIVDPEFEINNVVSTSPDVVTTLKKDKEKNEYIVEVSLNKDTKPGRLNGKIVIYTNSKNMEEVTVPFFGRIVGDISVYPPRISCGIVPQKEEKTVSVFATAYNKDATVKSVNIIPDFLKAEFLKIEDKIKTYKISVTLKNSAPAGSFKGNLKIFTNSKNQPVIDVPVYGMVK